MRLYAAVAAGGFRRYATYRVATAAGVFTQTVFGFVLAYTFIALWHERPHLGGYDQAQALTFVWIGQSLLAATALIGGGVQEEIQERIRSGDIAVDLYRPADLQLWWLAADLGRAALQLAARGVVPLLVGALAFHLALPAGPRRHVDTLLVRPVPVFAQVAADRFALRRLGRLAQGLLVLGWALNRLDVAWTRGKIVLLPVTVVSGAAIFGALFALGGAFQFWATEAAEVQNAFTYGGSTLLQYPPTVFAKDLVRGVTFVVPLAFVNWLPALRILGRDDPLGLPGWLDFASPAAAVAFCAVAVAGWRAGLRGYRSTGS